MTGIQCLTCGDVIVSLHRHDMRYCQCKRTFVDGGRDYLRCGGEWHLMRTVKVMAWPEILALNLTAAASLGQAYENGWWSGWESSWKPGRRVRQRAAG